MGPLRLVLGGFAALTALIAALVIAGVVPSVRHGGNSSTLTVVGTSDVFDSNLVQAVLKPDFEAYERSHGQHVAFNYVSLGSGAAIAYAEAGTASALLVHAASLENQFVARGYSDEKFGRAIFYGDYVLLGPASDPASVMTNAPHDIVGAFQRIAAAGAAGKADFVSRGGTPGTTVQEHAIWALTKGVTTCSVSAADGGGVSPSTTKGSCPADPSPIRYPSWYHATGLNQGPNLTNANTCNYGAATNDCYVFTDRGTYEYLASQNEVPDLHIVTRDNSAGAPGGDTLLINSFHAYAVNPAKFVDSPNVTLNTPAALTFLNWVTSPVAQAAVGSYLSAGEDPPFRPDAAPQLTASVRRHATTGCPSFTVTGTLRNVVPGTPPLAGETITLSAMRTPVSSANRRAGPKVVATTTTDRNGHYRLRFAPMTKAHFTVSTGEIGQIEDATLSPVFSDLLAPTSRRLGHLITACKRRHG